MAGLSNFTGADNPFNMKIVFICGCLQPGADGVGDYSRKLAEELVKQGCHVSIIAMNDHCITEKKEDMQECEKVTFLYLRIPSSWQAPHRFNEAKAWIEKINPDWLSLQFVPFAFHQKGLPFGLSNQLAMLGADRKWHIMFHELWVGMGENNSVKQKLIGNLQRRIVSKLIKQLKPVALHTQCNLYFEKLKNKKPSVKKLPLFSNISFKKEIFRKSFLQNDATDNNITRFTFFGGLHKSSKLSELIDELKRIQSNVSASYEFLYIGRNGDELENHLRILQENGISYKVSGELNSEDISHLLSNSSFGVSTTSPEVIEKSGSVAAMKEHGLPVICIGKKLRIKNYTAINNTVDGIYFLEDVKQLLTHRPVIHSCNNLSVVASKFLHDINVVEINGNLTKQHQPALA